MKLVIRLGAAFGLVALSACGQNGQEDAAENMDANSAMTDQSVLPIDDNAAGMDTLGNQLNQLNETGSTSATTANTAEDAAANSAENTTNSY
ncbi:MAG: hypothetical protein H0U34_00890 [Sphingomonas sp.]|nr:hypothetical protein [Sphingomonas sp.]